jgi:pSer/pThr/pTyr-binding forkhead associated (FHA) protein
MNSVLHYRCKFVLEHWQISFVFLVLIFISSQAQARNWQLILVPESSYTEADLQNEISIPDSYLSIEKGLTYSLSNSSETLIDKRRLFDECKFYLCGEQDISAFMEKVRMNAAQVHLVILYSLGGEQNNTLFVRLLDPLSYRVRFSESLNLLDGTAEAKLFMLGEDMGKLIAARLDGLQAQTQFSLVFDGFLFEELNGLTTKVLTNTGNTQLVLMNSSFSYLLFEKYFKVSNSQYRLSTALSASQVEQLLTEFFIAQSLEATITFTQTEDQQLQFSIERSGKPYMPTLIMVILLLLLCILLIVVYMFRRYLDACLHKYADERNADMWLDTYKKTTFLLLGLQSKWMARAPYWLSLKKESMELSDQAKLYYDAGDMHTAKLFLSKSLHSNTANFHAKKLVETIKLMELNEKSLSDDEQWIRSKLAKAMNNYRQKQPVKALRHLYKAGERAQKRPSLKKQSKAIKKLAKQIKQEFSTNEQSLLINCSSDSQGIVLCQNATLHLGRRPTNDNVAWTNSQESMFYINHNSVSRAGRQCSITRQENGFFLTDNGSKNGTFINNKSLVPHQPVKLHNTDLIHLGGNIPFVSVALRVKLSTKETLLELSVDSQSMNLLDKQELNRLWPDNSLALKTKLVCVHSECCLVLNRETENLHVFEFGDMPSQMKMIGQDNIIPAEEKNKDTTLWAPLCRIRLGENASVRSLLSSNDMNSLHLDESPLLGEVPLILPCSVSYIDTSFYFSNYESTSSRYTDASVTTTPSIVDKQ